MVQLLPDLDRVSRRRFKIHPALLWWTLSRGNDPWVQLIGSLGARRRESKWEAPLQCKDHRRWKTQNRGFAQENVRKAESEGTLLALACANGYESIETLDKDFETNSFLHGILKGKQSRQRKKSFFIDNATTTTTYSLLCAREEPVNRGWSHSH